MNTQQQRFKSDMEDAGFEVERYRGRNFYKGFAVRVNDNPDDIVRATNVKLQKDNMGHGWILYPQSSMTDEEFSQIEI